MNTVVEFDRNDRATAVEAAQAALSSIGDDVAWRLAFSTDGEIQSEGTFFLEAVKCNQARELVEALVRAIVARNMDNQSPLLAGTDEQAGSQAVLALASHSADYLGLYAEFLGSIDLDHAHNHHEAIADLLSAYGTAAVAEQLSMVLRDWEIFVDSYGWVGADSSTSALEPLQALESDDIEQANAALERLPGFFDNQNSALGVLDAMCEALTRFDALTDEALLGSLRYLLEHSIDWGRAAGALTWLGLRHGEQVRDLVEGLDGYRELDAAEKTEALRSALTEANLRNVFDARPPLRGWLQALTVWSPKQQLEDETEHLLSALGYDDSLAAFRGRLFSLRRTVGLISPRLSTG